jgi:uncharacterized small protein (DUF1192 family)
MAATSCNGSQQLDPRRLRAADLISLGQTDAEVAQELGVDRTSLWRWRQQPAFQVELERRRDELWTTSLDRLPQLLASALDVVAAALDHGDRNVAMQILKLLRAGDAALERVRAKGADTTVDSGPLSSVAELDAQIELLSAELDRRARLAAEGIAASPMAPSERRNGSE